MSDKICARCKGSGTERLRGRYGDILLRTCNCGALEQRQARAAAKRHADAVHNQAMRWLQLRNEENSWQVGDRLWLDHQTDGWLLYNDWNDSLWRTDRRTARALLYAAEVYAAGEKQ